MTDGPDKKAPPGKPFQKGVSGNPKGRPQGSRNKATLAAEALLDDEALALTRKAIERALEGDATALRLCIERLIPIRRERPVEFEAGKIEGPQDALAAVGRVIEALGSGQLTTSEAAAVASVLDGYRRAFETVELEARLAALENQAEATR